MRKKYSNERFYIDSTGTACVSGGARYDPAAERKYRKDQHRQWLASLTPALRWVVGVIAKQSKFARGHERTMAMHAFHSQFVDKHAPMPKSDALAEICMARKEEFELFVADHFQTHPKP